MQDVIAYIDANRGRFVDDLVEWVQHPLDLQRPQAHARRGAERRAPGGARCAASAPGASRCGPPPATPPSSPSGCGAPGKPTLLVYGHHDVQPVDPLGEWVTPPFEPSMRGGRLWGRGVVDDKGQVYIHAKAIEAFVEDGGQAPHQPQA